MTTSEMAHMIGRRGLMPANAAGDIACEIEVVDVKQAYGVLRFRVRPVAGRGETWIDAARFTAIKEGSR